MAASPVPHVCNDLGVQSIALGVKELQCVGATPPFDHPHVFLDMGAADEVVCPYCSTLYRFDGRLKSVETDPAGCLVKHA